MFVTSRGYLNINKSNLAIHNSLLNIRPESQQTATLRIHIIKIKIITLQVKQQKAGHTQKKTIAQEDNELDVFYTPIPFTMLVVTTLFV